MCILLPVSLLGAGNVKEKPTKKRPETLFPVAFLVVSAGDKMEGLAGDNIGDQLWAELVVCQFDGSGGDIPAGGGAFQQGFPVHLFQ